MSRLQIVVNNNENACRPLKYQEKIRKTAKITSGEQAGNKRVRLIQGERLHFSARLMRNSVAAVGFARTIMKKPGAVPGLATYFQQLMLPNIDLVTRSIAIPNNAQAGKV